MNWIDKAMELVEEYCDANCECPTWRLKDRDAARAALRAHLEAQTQAVAPQASEIAPDVTGLVWRACVRQGLPLDMRRDLVAEVAGLLVAAEAQQSRDSLKE